MPVYRYRCTACEQRFEVQAKMADAPPTVAPGCGRKGEGCCLVKELTPVAGIIHGRTTLSAAKTHLDKASDLLGGASTNEPHAPGCATGKSCAWDD